MKKSLLLSFILSVLLSVSIQAQDNWRYVSSENVNLKLPENWMMLNSSKPKGPVCIKAYDPDSKQFVEIRGERSKINLKTRVNDIATLRSSQQNFEYMQIDKVKKATFNNQDAQLLNY
ncbi:MAG: hypothetical protein IJ681_09945, partial [Bacteroidales bacterium]|nr:hypothetical protein [Bacteroidales bacterium]